jgi:hypothetical protein
VTIRQQKWEKNTGLYTKKNFLDLFHNKISHIQVDSFLTKDQCYALYTSIKNMNLGQLAYDFEFGKNLKTEHYLYEHYVYEQEPVEVYLPKAKHSISTCETLWKLAGVDPVFSVINFLTQFFGEKVSIAEQNGQQYNFAIVRDLKSSALLHADYAGFSPEYWSISKVIAQYGWNIYLTDPGEGGELIIYNKPWEEMTDEKYYMETTRYGYQKEVVAHAESVSVFPKAGLLVFFNSRNFHEIKASAQSRVTVGGHIGLTAKEELLLWV